MSQSFWYLGFGGGGTMKRAVGLRSRALCLPAPARAGWHGARPVLLRLTTLQLPEPGTAVGYSQRGALPGRWWAQHCVPLTCLRLSGRGLSGKGRLFLV